MKIAVLGAGGFIGRAACARLTAGGHKVLALVRRPVPGLPVPSRVASYTDPKQIRAVLQDCDWLLHAAAGSTPGSTASQPYAEIAANLTPSLALVEALQSTATCAVLYISSGGTVYGDCSTEPTSESTPLRPRSYHGAAKASVEMFLSAFASQYGASVTVLRPSNVYGPGQALRPGFGIIATAMAAALSDKPITLWGDGSAVRDFLYIDDLIDFIQLIITGNRLPGFAVFNAASGEPLSIVELLARIDAVTGRPLHRIFFSERSVDVPSISPSPRKALETFGWRAATTLSEGLAATWTSFKQAYIR